MEPRIAAAATASDGVEIKMFFRNKSFPARPWGQRGRSSTEYRKCADKGGANVMAQHVRRLGDLAHCREQRPERRQRYPCQALILPCGESGGRQHPLLAHGFHVSIHQAVDIGRVARREIAPERVADETHELGVFGNVGILAENRARFRLFHIAFDADYAFPVHFGKQGIKAKGQCLQIADLLEPGSAKRFLRF